MLMERKPIDCENDVFAQTERLRYEQAKLHFVANVRFCCAFTTCDKCPVKRDFKHCHVDMTAGIVKK